MSTPLLGRYREAGYTISREGNALRVLSEKLALHRGAPRWLAPRRPRHGKVGPGFATSRRRPSLQINRRRFCSRDRDKPSSGSRNSRPSDNEWLIQFDGREVHTL